MIPVEKFIETIHCLLLDTLKIESSGFNPSYSTNIHNFTHCLVNNTLISNNGYNVNGRCIWWHEEPLNLEDFSQLKNYTELNLHTIALNENTTFPFNSPIFTNFRDVNFWTIANSEISELKKTLFSDWQVLDWYFFFHGFAALDWYRAYRFINFDYMFSPSKLFICLNHQITKKRNYRLNLLSMLKEEDLITKGYISCPLLNQDILKEELFSNNSFLSVNAKKSIYSNLFNNCHPYVLDKDCNYNFASADMLDPKYTQTSLFHVVTETNFYEKKLHLTEKIFKPIALKKPFILVSSPGNLKYLKSYGFQTFDKWIDEDYDDELDDDLRLMKIVNQLKKFSTLDQNDLLDLFHDMKPVIEYNHKHFFTDFKNIIIDEMIDNFIKCVFIYNKDRSERFQLPVHLINFENVKKTLKS